ncbi:MAG: biosynthetic arginine decarboxylase [Deltaproteobacteria bacterium]|nr:biosynthetic arginine decarboxylase [Deltaproteobacteria bacterium]MBW2361322.1 biosynthetic arginine decarboxylase [Deltaproteobacteria bacterium]
MRRGWTIRDSLELYSVPNWGDGFFGINTDGNVTVNPQRDAGPAVDLLELTRNLQRRGLRTPLLVRFSDILAARVAAISDAFQKAIRDYEYRGAYRGVYPIKVNQQRHVVEEIVQHGAAAGVGLEAGSKPELLIALALLDTPDARIICNGYKDRAYIELALLAQKLGRTPIVVIDRFHEIDLVLKTARDLGIRPHLGVRARLTSKGAGKWGESTGDRSKFGLSALEMVNAVERLRAEDMLDCLELLHFHIGSQITAIRAHKEALAEAVRIFVGLQQLGATPNCIDVGGGLGVDYDGSSTNFHSSMNYSTQEYANDVVAAIQGACDEAGIAHPDIVTESGRAMVAHHSVLIFDVLGVNQMSAGEQPRPVTDTDHKVIQELAEIYQGVTRKNVQESYHDLLQLKEEAATLFSLGYLDLEERARVERLFWSCCEKVLRIARELPEIPEDLEDLERGLADTYYGNLSVFQSAPDHWAVKQLFPVMPIHRLNEEPNRRGVFADLTCDSDGKIDKFIDHRDVKDVLELHAYTGAPYYIAMFLVGAYQEILGDLHNLFGDTDAVHVRVEADGSYSVDHVVEGDSVDDVLHYVQYDRRTLIEKVRRTVETALRSNRISIEESARLRRRYQQGLEEYTYLTRDD